MSNKTDLNYVFDPRRSKTLLYRCHLILRQSKKVLVNFHVGSLDENLRNLIILAGNFCLRFNAPFAEVAVFNPYLNLNTRMMATATSKRNVRCRSGSRHRNLRRLFLTTGRSSLIFRSKRFFPSFKTFSVY